MNLNNNMFNMFLLNNVLQMANYALERQRQNIVNLQDENAMLRQDINRLQDQRTNMREYNTEL